MNDSSSATAQNLFASISKMEVSDKNRALVDKALSGDASAFETIVSEYKGLVFYVVRSMIHDQAQHDDLAQDIFVRVYESLRRFGFRCRLATWISRIAYNMCLNHIRRSKSHPQDNPDYHAELESLDESEQIDSNYMIASSSPTPHAMTCQKETATAVAGSVERLPRPYRLVITLHYLEGFSLPELAESLGLPIGTIKSHLFRARAMLKNDLLKTFTVEELIE